MTPAREPLAVIGVGYAGLVTAAGFAELGSDVWCVDVDAEKIAGLQAGDVPIFEPGLNDVIAASRERMHFTTELNDALEQVRLLFVVVGTPPTHSGDADLSAVQAVVDALPRTDGHALVMKSTVPSGTGAAIKRRLAERGEPAISYVSCPEFLREGSAVEDFRSPDRIVVGDDGDWAGDAVVELHAPLNAPLVRTDITSAEMIKLASNALLATKISFINEIANVCDEVGADVTEVARGMGLDPRLGSSFLNAGLGFGGSCLAGEESVLVRQRGRTTLLRLEEVWRRVEADDAELGDEGVLCPRGLEVLAWVPGSEEPSFMPVMALTRREYDGDMIEVRTKMGRRVRCTADHPWIVSDGAGAEPEIKLAHNLTTDDWVPLAHKRLDCGDRSIELSLVGGVEASRVSPEKVIVRPDPRALGALLASSLDERREIFSRARSAAARSGEVKRTQTLRLDESVRAEISARGMTLGTASNGNFVPSQITLDEAFWRIVGLYLAEGHCSTDGGRGVRHRIAWSFHPTNEQHLVDEVAAFWLRHGIRTRVHRKPTSHQVSVSSRLLGAWWMHVLGLGRTSYTQRLPDLIWDRGGRDKWALLSGLWEGDGSWSLICGGPSVVLEWGTVSDELADGVMRLLGDVGVVPQWRVGRVAKSTKDTHWLRVTGADQIERSLPLVPQRDRARVLASIASQKKRIAPTGYRRFDAGPSWVRVTSAEREKVAEAVYSLEVPSAHTFVTTGGVTVHNCFPKDVSALKQLAGNSGYHFQLLNAVIEVNELQKRRVISKLQKHLGSLAGKTVALLGLAFKPETDDMREASSLVLSARLQAEGAHVRAYDPVAEERARGLMPGIELAGSALDALAGADACVLVTEWDEFKQLDWAVVADRMAGTLLVDGRNALDPQAIRDAGLTYEGIGRR